VLDEPSATGSLGRVARALLILPTDTYRAADFVAAAEALGIELSVASEEEAPLGAEDRFVRIDCRHPEVAAEAIADLAATTPIDAIVPVDDAGVVIAALAAEHLGLPHSPPDAAAANRNKAMMRRRLEQGEVPQPSFALVGAQDDPAAICRTLGYPVVIKPLSLSASRGVIRVDDDHGARQASERVRRILAVAGRNPDEPLLAERFMPGPEVSVEGLLSNGTLEVLAVFDKPDPLDGPFFEETIFVTPSRLHPEVLDEVAAVSQRATRAIGLREGAVHVELRVTRGEVRVVEVAARSIGGLCGRSLHFGLLDTPLEVLVLRNALGMRKPGLRRSPGASGVMMLPIPATGTLQAVHGADEARAVPGIVELDLSIPVGRPVVALPEGDRYLGFLFARAGDQTAVEAALRTAHGLLRFDIT
jgi:biotin carboxylase